jgi:hypothetical protein
MRLPQEKKDFFFEKKEKLFDGYREPIWKTYANVQRSSFFRSRPGSAVRRALSPSSGERVG